jgi:hypothetical protein
MAHQAFTTIGDFYDAKGKLIPLQDLEHGPAQALKKYRRRELWKGRARNRQRIGESVEIELIDKVPVLRALAQHLGLLSGPGQVDDGSALIQAIRKARERARIR